MFGIRQVSVIGPSMEPALHNGERWLMVPGRPRVDRIVVFREPGRADLLSIKRVAEVRPDGLWVLGDNRAASRDSRHFGVVSPSSVLGVLRWRLT